VDCDQQYFWLLTVKMANSIDIVLIKTKVWFVVIIEKRHDSGLYVRMPQTKRVTDRVYGHLQ